MSTANALRALLLIDMVIMALLAFFFLRERRLSWLEYCCWGLLALIVPLLGLFLVILYRPGVWRIPSAASPITLSGFFLARRFALFEPRRRKRLVRRE